MKGSYIKKISILLTIIFLSSYVIASSFVQLDTKEFKKNEDGRKVWEKKSKT